jgi:hypothetical protein
MVEDNVADDQDLSFPEILYDLLKIHMGMIPYGQGKNEPAGPLLPAYGRRKRTAVRLSSFFTAGSAGNRDQFFSFARSSAESWNWGNSSCFTFL